MRADNASLYDTRGLYRSAGFRTTEEAATLPDPPAAEVERMAAAWRDRDRFVADELQPAASAILSFSEYLLATSTLPAGQRAVIDLVRRQARTLMWGLSALVASGDAAAAASREPVRRQQDAVA